MANLISTTITAAGPQRGAWPQQLNITQSFDAPVYISDDFAVMWGGNQLNQPGAMFVKPIQYVPTQLNYQTTVSPFSYGKLGILRTQGTIGNVFGDPVDLYIGNDYNFYNTDLYPYLLSRPLVVNWGSTIPASAICPNNTNPGFTLNLGPFPRPAPITPDTYQEGNFYLWVNWTWKPDRESEGIPFVWEPPFYYSWSMFGELLESTQQDVPPVYSEKVRYNVCSSGNTDQWDTCGWINQYNRWRGKLQVWCFCSDVFAEDAVPWQYPAVANPIGDLTPDSVFGFTGAGIPLQWYVEKPFNYISV